MVIQVAARLDAMKAQFAAMGTVINVSTGQMKRMVDTLQAGPVIAQATKIVSAIEGMGGQIKLTGDQAARFQKQVGDAISVLGKDAPQAFLAAEASLKKIATSAETAEHKTSLLDGTFAKMAGAFSVGSLADRALGGIGELITGSFEAASRIQDLSVKMGVSTDAVQRWDFAAKQSGTTIDAISTAVAQMSNRLVEGDSSARQSLAAMGLELDKIRAMRPEDAFNAIAAGVANVHDPMTQVKIAMDLFGRSGAEVLPAIREGLERIGLEAPIMAERTITALDQAQKKWQAAKASFSAGLATGAATASDQADTAWDWLKALSGFDLLAGGMLVAQNRTGVSKSLVDGLKSLNQPLADVKDGFAETAKASEDFNKQNGDTAAQLAKVQAALDRFAAAAKKLADEEFNLDRLVEQNTQAFMKQWMVLDEPSRILRLAGDYRSLADSIRAVPEFRPHVDNSGLINGLVPGGIQIGSLGPTPPEPRAWLAYASALSEINVALATLGQHGSQAWQQIARAGSGALSIAQNYTAAMHSASQITDDAARSAAEMAAAENLAISAATFGFGLYVEWWERMRANQAQLQHDIQATSVALRELGAVASWPSGQQGNDTLRQLTQQLDRLRLASQQVQGPLGGLQDLVSSSGWGVLPDSFSGLTTALASLPGLTDDERAAIQRLVGQPSWEVEQKKAEQYGIALSSLGASFNQSRLNSSFDSLFTDFSMFQQQGANMNDVLAGMSDEVQAVVNQARQFGTQIPEYMRPMLQALVDSGQLFDENGNALRDLSSFRFSESIESSFSRMADLLEQIVGLLGGVGGGFNDIARRFGYGGAWIGGPTLGPGGKPIGNDIQLPGGGDRGLLSILPMSTFAPGGGGGGVQANVSITINAIDSRDVEDWLRGGADRQIANAVIRKYPEAMSFVGAGS